MAHLCIHHGYHIGGRGQFLLDWAKWDSLASGRNHDGSECIACHVYVHVFVHVCMCMCLYMCVCACVCTCVHMCVCACVSTAKLIVCFRVDSPEEILSVVTSCCVYMQYRGCWC